MRLYINSNFRLTAISMILLIAISVASCVKSRPGETSFGSLKPVVLIPEGGLNAFSSEALVFPGTDASDTAAFHVNYAATNVAPEDEVVTIGVDQTALTNYNSNSGAQYQVFPDSIYSAPPTTVTVKKGDNYTDAIPLVVYPSKVDPTQNYMLPISITAVPAGSLISSNFGTIYYHFIGNPIAGAYTQTWIRYNGGDTISGTLYANKVVGTVLLSPIDNTTVSAISLGTGETDVISFANNGGVLSNFSVSIPPLAGITIGPAVMETADPVNGVYRVYFTYVNSAGAPRCIINVFTRQ